MKWARRDLPHVDPRGRSSTHLNAILCVPHGAFGMALVVRSPSVGLSHLSHPLADSLRQVRLATCVVDLIDPRNPDEIEKAADLEFLRQRLDASIEYLATNAQSRHLPLGIVADDASLAAAVGAAVADPVAVRALALWGGGASLAAAALSSLTTPTVLVVPGRQRAFIEQNQQAFAALDCPSQLAVILGASPNFSELGMLVAAQLVVQEWFEKYLWDAQRCRQLVAAGNAD